MLIIKTATAWDNKTSGVTFIFGKKIDNTSSLQGKRRMPKAAKTFFVRELRHHLFELMGCQPHKTAMSRSQSETRAFMSVTYSIVT